MIILTSNPIKSARKSLNMTADKVADELNKLTGGNVTKVEICKWETSKHKPNQNTIFALSKIFNVNPVKFYQDVELHFANWRKAFNKRRIYEKNN